MSLSTSCGRWEHVDGDGAGDGDIDGRAAELRHVASGSALSSVAALRASPLPAATPICIGGCQTQRGGCQFMEATLDPPAPFVMQ